MFFYKVHAICDLLMNDFEEGAVDEIRFKQWTQTDRSELNTLVLPLAAFIDKFCEKLLLLARHDFTAKMQASFMKGRS